MDNTLYETLQQGNFHLPDVVTSSEIMLITRPNAGSLQQLKNMVLRHVEGNAIATYKAHNEFDERKLYWAEDLRRRKPAQRHLYLYYGEEALAYVNLTKVTAV